MRRSMTLIELIFSMVIIAIAFTVFPKIIWISAKTSKTMLKEEAMYSGVALIGLIKSLPWDEKNTLFDDILLVDSGSSQYECSYSLGSGGDIYRKGGFLGSRNCRNKIKASGIGDDGESIYDDIDDFDGYDINATDESGKRRYTLHVDVDYIEDMDKDGGSFTKNDSTLTTNTKYIELNITAQTLQSELGSHIASFWYVSSNIGQLMVNRLQWTHP